MKVTERPSFELFGSEDELLDWIRDSNVSILRTHIKTVPLTPTRDEELAQHRAARAHRSRTRPRY